MRKTVITLAYLFCMISYSNQAQTWTEEGIMEKLSSEFGKEYNTELYYQLAKLKIRSEIDSAFHYAELSADMATELKSKPLLAKSYFLLGYLYEISDDVPNTLKYYVGAKRVYEDLGDIPRVEDLDENLFKVAQDNGALEAAEFFANNRLNYLDDLPDFKRRSDIYFDLGLVFIQSNELIKANKYYWKALFEYEEHAIIKDTVGYSKILFQLGLIQKKMADSYKDKALHYDSALYFYQKSVQMSRSPKRKILYFNNLGNLKLKQSLLDDARINLKIALDLERIHRLNRMLPYTYNNLGKLALTELKLDSAHNYFKQSILANISSKTPLENIMDKTNNINFYSHDELEISLSYMDSIYWQDASLVPLDESVTAKYFKDHLAKQVALRSLKEEYIMSVALKENTLVANRLAAKLEREKMIRWGGFFALLLSISLAIWYWMRVKRMNASMNDLFAFQEQLEEEERGREY